MPTELPAAPDLFSYSEWVRVAAGSHRSDALYRGTTWNRQESVSLTEPSRNWTGAPRSPQRTWAENDMFRLLLLFDFAKAMVGFALLFGPGTLWRTWGTRPVSTGFC